MRVLVVSEPGVDGVFRFAEALCHFLHSEGIQVDLAYSDRRGCDRLTELVAFVEASGGRTVNLRVANRPTAMDAYALGALLRLVRATKPDIIHSNSSKAGFLARMLRLVGVRAPQIYQPHAYKGMGPEAGRFDIVYNFTEAVLARFSHTIIVSSGERSFALDRLRIPPSRLSFLPNGVDSGIFSPASPSEKIRLREELNLPLHAPVLGFMGRSARQKDPVTLYRAFAAGGAGLPIVLFHVGRGDLDGELGRITEDLGIRDRVIRRPYMSTPVDFYRAVDGFILTSRYEGFSLAALEALACNLPVILSEVSGNLDLLELPLSHAGRAAPGDIEGFAHCIRSWHGSLSRPGEVNHRELVRSRHEIRDCFAAVLGLYRVLIGRSTPQASPSPKFGEVPQTGRAARAWSFRRARRPSSNGGGSEKLVQEKQS